MRLPDIYSRLHALTKADNLGLGLLAAWPYLALMPRGDGRPVMLLPGYGADESSMRPLGKFLNYLGYDVHEWGIGRNRGHVNNYVQRVGARAEAIHEDRNGETVTLIGWSLGGVVARETARLYESCVREVITMGTPVIKASRAAPVRGRQWPPSAGERSPSGKMATECPFKSRW